MTDTYDLTYYTQYGKDIQHLAQQKTSKLISLFPNEPPMGNINRFELMAALPEGDLHVGGVHDTQYDNAVHSERACTTNILKKALLINDLEKFKSVIGDPTNEYSTALSAMHGRFWDQTLIQALYGDTLEFTGGALGSVSTSALPSGQKIAHGSAALTVDKLYAAMTLMATNDVDIDGEDMILILPPQGVNDLFTDTNNAQLLSTDYQSNKVVPVKSLPEFRGWQIVQSNRISPITPGSVHRAILCTRSSLKVFHSPVTIKVAELPNKDHNHHIWSCSKIGASRSDDKKVVEIAFQYS